MNDPTVTLISKARIPTEFGEFSLYLYRNTLDEEEHLAFVFGEVAAHKDVLVRVHSECFTGEVLGSRRCDCGEQLRRALRLVAECGEGVVVYLRQEGRGIGLSEKLRAYNLQDRGYDTVEANLLLGHQADERDYTVAALILRDLTVASIRLLTNNPEKISRLREVGIPVRERIPLKPLAANGDNRRYLETKMTRMAHLFELKGDEEDTSLDYVRLR